MVQAPARLGVQFSLTPLRFFHYVAGRHSRWLQAAASAAVLFSAVFALAMLWVRSDTAAAQTRSESGPVALQQNRAKGDTYCGVFKDPSECEAQKGAGVAKY